jgi:hypothetical protein
MITYQEEKFSDVVEEVKVLLPEHYEELTVSKNFPLAPDWTKYENMSRLGILKLYTVRDDRVLIGYTVMIVGTGLHYKTCLVASEDLYYLRKEYRKGRTGIKMFKFVEDELRKLKVDRIVMGTKVYSDNSSLFEYLGYRMYEKLFTKEL